MKSEFKFMKRLRFLKVFFYWQEKILILTNKQEIFFGRGVFFVSRKLKFGVIFGIIIFLLTSAILYFFQSEEKNPAFAMKNVEIAVANHDKEQFYKFVDIDSVLNSSCDEVLEGLADSDKSMSIEAREAVKNFTQMLKAPLMLSLKSAVDNYIETGKFNASEDLGVKDILNKTGIDKIEIRGVENIFVNREQVDEAFADIKIFHPEIGEEFIL